MKKSQDNFWVVGIGASAGGLEALSSFFRSLKPHPPAAFIVAQHLAPHARSMMVELLSRQTNLTVSPVKDHQSLQPGHVYIVPPNHDVSFEDNDLKLTVAGTETRPKPSVDFFFQSLALTFKRRAVGIILSGTGTDGSEGIRTIKENGGVTLVQGHESAKYDGMPRSAVETGMVDVVMTPEELGDKLFSLLEVQTPQTIEPKDEIDFSNIVQFLKKEIGADFSQYKISTIQRRIEKRMAKFGLVSAREYYHYLEDNPGEFSFLAQEMLVSVTSFFRDTEAFEVLSTHLEQVISRKQNNEELRIWSAGCATGEEPYSLAFMIAEICSKHSKMLPVKIFATDLDHEALAMARLGVYKQEDVSDLPKEILAKYFDRKDNVYEVKKIIRDMIVFARQDLVQNPPFVKLDMVTCRNVLIYFESSLQNRIFEIFHYSLKPNGLLFLGKSETANVNMFETVDKKNKLYKKINAISNLSTSPHRYTLASRGVPPLKTRLQDVASISQSATLQLLKQFNLSAVVVDEESVIVHFIGNVSEFISLPEGMADFRLTNLLPKSSSTEFVVLLKKCTKEQKLIRSRLYKLEKDPKKNFTFSINPLHLPEESFKKLYLVSFELKKIEEVEATSEFHSNDIPKRVIELELEVAATKENLQTVIEELEISNEELQSLNEELSSTNEELQASNEELETTNEEMQSTNEELMTLNEELNIKSSELRVANVSMENILSSIASPLLVLDRDIRLLRYNQYATHIFHLTINDLYAPITRASCNCEIANFEKGIRTTIETGKISELRCEAVNRAYQIRIHPNRDENNVIIGAIVVFFDNTEFMQAQEKLLNSDRRIRSIIDGTPALIYLKDSQGKYLSANKSFEQTFKLREDDIIGRSDRELFDEEMASQLRDGDLEVLLKRQNSERQEILMVNGKKTHFFISRFPMYGKNDKSPYAVGTVAIDISDQMKAREDLQASESRYKAIIEDQAVFVCRHTPDGNFTFTNRAFGNYFGGTDITNQSLNFLSIVDRVDHAKVSQEISRLSLESPIVQYEHRVKNHSFGPARWVRWIHRALFNEENKIVEFQAVGFDTTEIHNKTTELLEKENLFAQVLEHTSDFLSVYKMKDGELILESFNQSSGKFKNMTQNRFLGMKLTELLDPINQAEIIKHYERCVATKGIISFDEEVPGPSGSRYLSNTLVPTLDDSQEVMRVVVISKDISKLKRTELALRDEKQNAEAANRAKSDFLASMSHELRTPLNVIMGMSQLLTRSQIKPEHLKLVESISRSSKVLLSLIEDVLDLSKIEAGKIHFDSKPFSLKLLTHDVFQSFETLANDKKIELKIEEDFDADLILLGDQIRLKQILINLVGNAIKFTDKGSVVAKVQTVSHITSGPTSVYFEVKDSGIGIKLEDFNKIFKRFSQADTGNSRKFGGTGLGLAISKQLVELMNGTIGFESKEGEGSIFWFQVNLQKATRLDQQRDAKSFHADLSGKKVLAVDDSPESLRVIELLLKEAGTEVFTAGSGKEALEVIKNNTLDVVFMDMQMPEMDGLETTKIIRTESSKNKDLPIIALTANAMPGDREKCISSGMNDYATKPVQLNMLQMLISKWVKKR